MDNNYLLLCTAFCKSPVKYYLVISKYSLWIIIQCISYLCLQIFVYPQWLEMKMFWRGVLPSLPSACTRPPVAVRSGAWPGSSRSGRDPTLGTRWGAGTQRSGSTSMSCLGSSPVSQSTGTLKTAHSHSKRRFGTRLHTTTFATNKYTAPISMDRIEHGQEKFWGNLHYRPTIQQLLRMFSID